MAGSDGSKPGMGLNESAMSQILAHAAINWMPDLSFGRLHAVFNLGEELWFNPDSFVSDSLAVRLASADEGCRPFAQIGSRVLFEAIIDLACVNKIIALAPSKVDAVPVIAV